MRRADPGGPDPTGPPRASGVLRAAPASRKCMSSVACHNMGWDEPETAKGMVSSTWLGGSVAATWRR